MKDKTKNATISISLKADSGYSSKETHRVSVDQYTRITQILSEKQIGDRFVIDFVFGKTKVGDTITIIEVIPNTYPGAFPINYIVENENKERASIGHSNINRLKKP